jgi:hypothetical protein
LALKGNQGQLHQDIELFFQDAAKSNFREVPHGFHQTVDGDHGRVETRKYWIASEKSVKRKRLIAGWDNQFLANVLHAGF